MNDEIEQMIDAITKAEAVIDGTRMMVLQGQEYDLALIDFDGALKMLRAALSLPRRQCDVGTPEEQEERFGTFCISNKTTIPLPEKCTRCRIRGEANVHKCMFEWAQTPYALDEIAGTLAAIYRDFKEEEK